MPTQQIRLVARFEEAALVNSLLETAFEDYGYPVTMEETVPYSEIWSVEAILFDMSGEDALEMVRDVLADVTITSDITVSELPEDTNWIAMSEEIRKPVSAGRFFVHGRHDRDKRPINAISMEIDAEMAFGTGHHATTWCCLTALDRLLLQRRFQRPLDLGTGTGVLAIAAARTLRVPVLATDIDAVSVGIAKTNAQLNGVGGLVECIHADGMKHRRILEEAPYDLILANILARPLCQLAAPVSRALADNGVLVLSGLRTVDCAMVLSAYRMQGLYLQHSITEGMWMALVLAR
jgi:ribosomal protein L11 methyltransferase